MHLRDRARRPAARARCVRARPPRARRARSRPPRRPLPGSAAACRPAAARARRCTRAEAGRGESRAPGRAWRTSGRAPRGPRAGGAPGRPAAGRRAARGGRRRGRSARRARAGAHGAPRASAGARRRRRTRRCSAPRATRGWRRWRAGTLCGRACPRPRARSGRCRACLASRTIAAAGSRVLGIEREHVQLGLEAVGRVARPGHRAAAGIGHGEDLVHGHGRDSARWSDAVRMVPGARDSCLRTTGAACTIEPGERRPLPADGDRAGGGAAGGQPARRASWWRRTSARIERVDPLVNAIVTPHARDGARGGGRRRPQARAGRRPPAPARPADRAQGSAGHGRRAHDLRLAVLPRASARPRTRCSSSACARRARSSSARRTRRSGVPARTRSTASSAPPATPGTRRARRAARAAAPQSRWPAACCRSPTAATSAARCATRRPGAACSACARRPASSRAGRSRRPGCRSRSRGRWLARPAISRSCSGALAGGDPRDPLSQRDARLDLATPLAADLRGRRVAWSPDVGGLPIEPAVRDALAAALPLLGEIGLDVERRTSPTSRAPTRSSRPGARSCPRPASATSTTRAAAS